ncbi:pilus assembly protein TadG-related protein [Streptomyces sp. NPDC052000]|uniref:pilus assembly protein TadG-related protein n=1 Tax=Streptomyces sp. NPDC052000 TaxID=3155676 RepID=UPI00344D3B9A
MFRRLNSDKGQAFPIYITVVAGLLFLAFAYFAWGQASVKRNDTQTAADAASLAAAQDARDTLRTAMVDGLDMVTLQTLLDGKSPLGAPLTFKSCFAAGHLADENDARTRLVDGCYPGNYRGQTAYYVSVESKKPVGKSVIPATETRKGTASAVAVIQPRCRVMPTGASLPNGTDEAYLLVCDGRPDLLFDRMHVQELFPRASDLFSVHLVNAN